MGFLCFALLLSELGDIIVFIQTLHCLSPDFLKTTEISLSACVTLFECKHKLISKQDILPDLGTIQFNAISISSTSSISPRYKTDRLTRQVRRVRCLVTEDETFGKIVFQLNPMNSIDYFLNHQIIHLLIKYILMSFTCQTLSQALGIWKNIETKAVAS